MSTAPRQHTPGPWSAQINHCNNAVISPDGFDIALVSASGFDSEANARLIAAAPEMLATLEDCLAFTSANVPPSDRLASITALARAAIAKATGGAA